MNNDNSINNQNNYDPSGDEEFYRNLSEAFAENDEDEEDINLDINTDDDFQWFDIEASVKEAVHTEVTMSLSPSESNDEEPLQEEQITQEADLEIEPDTDETLEVDFEEELFANALREAAAAFDNSEDIPDVDVAAYEGEPAKDEVKRRREEDEIFASINASLAAQVSSELGSQEPIPAKEPKKKSKKLRKILIPVVSVLLLLCCSFALVVGTSAGRNWLLDLATRYAYGRLNKDQGNSVEPSSEFDDVQPSTEYADGPTPTDIPEKDIDLNADEGTARREEEVINILLLGEEAIDAGGGRGRTDLMIIGTMDTRDGSIKLTSLMRDMLVAIPGYKDNKLNAAYTFGGIPLLYETIELNFDIELDGYVLVNFESFEQIIDDLGGIELTLTRAESNYLNTTNYISKPQYRTTVAGTQILNGNQVLGYCRIRYVPTDDNLKNDYGRTSRHRIVLNAIFDKYQSKSLIDLALMMNKILPQLTTDLTQEQFTTCLKEFVALHSLAVEQYRLPINGAFDEGRVRGMDVLIPDLKKNVEALHEFIYGDYEE